MKVKVSTLIAFIVFVILAILFVKDIVDIWPINEVDPYAFVLPNWQDVSKALL